MITTHFREILEFDLLGLQPPPSAAARTSAGGSGSGSASGALVLPPLPPATAGELSLYQMQVVLDRHERAAALAGRPVAVPQFGGGSGGGAGDVGDEEEREPAAAVLNDGAGAEELDDVYGGDGGGDDELDAVVPLFRLVAGRAASSYGLDCARKGGIPKSIVDRARSVTRSLAAPGGRVEALAVPRGAGGASVGREVAQLRLARALLSVPDWRTASAEQLLESLQALHAVCSASRST